MKLKKLSEQVVVITGASSGIGLATARLAAQRGARVVMTARSEEGLIESAERIRKEGGKVEYVVADVADGLALNAVAEHAIRTFGGLDTWINNAGVSIFGSMSEVKLEDMRRMFDVTLWGVVHGTLAALPHLKSTGGALINIGSADRLLHPPMNAMYAAAKQAVKSFTDSLRIELEKEGAQVAVTLVKPASVDTPFFEHATNYTGTEPNPEPPVYTPEVVACAILECAERPIREIIVGGRVQLGAARRASGLSKDLLKATVLHRKQHLVEPKPELPRPPKLPATEPRAPAHEGALYVAQGTHGQERGHYKGHVIRSSPLTTAKLHPTRTALAALSLGLLVAAVLWPKA